MIKLAYTYILYFEILYVLFAKKKSLKPFGILLLAYLCLPLDYCHILTDWTGLARLR